MIEEKDKLSLNERELITMASTVESDFYVKISFYIGKLYPFSTQLPISVPTGKKVFFICIKHFQVKISLPSKEYSRHTLLAQPMTRHIKRFTISFLEVFLEDHELYLTIKIFLENNLNASLTAKKLYIHRNTLQYRIDKFVEKTGIQLKDFYGAFTVFLACILFEQENRQQLTNCPKILGTLCRLSILITASFR